MSAYVRVKSNKINDKFTFLQNLCFIFHFHHFSFVWQANGIEMRPILCSIKKIRFLCNFIGPPLEKCCIFFLSFSNTNIIKFGEKILREKNKCFEVKKLVNFKHCRLSYVVVYICTPSHRNTCIRFQWVKVSSIKQG